jgi:hypothetical protein
MCAATAGTSMIIPFFALFIHHAPFCHRPFNAFEYIALNLTRQPPFKIFFVSARGAILQPAG